MKQLTNEDFQTTVDAQALAVIDFWADWCGPCKMLAPTMESLATKYEGKALVAKVNVDDAGLIAQQFGVMSIPTVVFLKNGKEVARKVGVMAESAFATMIEENL